jgi:hypothetical protein
MFWRNHKLRVLASGALLARRENSVVGAASCEEHAFEPPVRSPDQFPPPRLRSFVLQYQSSKERDT